ncbi:hypothetical protein QRE66_10815 [Bacillus cereus]|nr:hypothetical protein QRE66_10815 [Bacillus cereus]
MPKRQTGWTEAKIFRYIKESRGQGELADGFNKMLTEVEKEKKKFIEMD